jgi:hypothetical protein
MLVANHRGIRTTQNNNSSQISTHAHLRHSLTPVNRPNEDQVKLSRAFRHKFSEMALQSLTVNAATKLQTINQLTFVLIRLRHTEHRFIFLRTCRIYELVYHCMREVFALVGLTARVFEMLHTFVLHS